MFIPENAFENVFCKMSAILSRTQCVYTLRPEQHGHHFVHNIFKCIFIKENFCILIQISLNFVLMDPINNKSALVHSLALPPNMCQAITWTNDHPVLWYLKASLGLDVVICYYQLDPKE